MPTISIFQKDFSQLVGQPASMSDIEQWMPLVKGEVKVLICGVWKESPGKFALSSREASRLTRFFLHGDVRNVASKLCQGWKRSDPMWRPAPLLGFP
jgi:hypothetical protein